MLKFRNWCFTINNYTEEDIAKLKETTCRYVIMGYEVGKNDTHHIQGFIQFDVQLRLSSMKKIHKTAHWEPMRGTVVQAVDYCKKDGKYDEIGEIITKGQRTDLKRARETWEETGKIRKIIEEEVNIQTIRTIELVAKYCEKERDFKPEVIWICGDTGKGKSKLARELCAGEDTYYKDHTKWWDGYDGHDNVVMDDFRASNMKLNELLKILDRYEHRIEQKGTFRQLLAKKIVITSVYHPNQAYRWDDEPCQQLLRRIDRIIEL